MDFNSKYKSSEIEEKLETVGYLKGAIGWSEIAHHRFANGTIMTFSSPITKGQVIMSLQGIGSISIYDEDGATKPISTSILPFAVDKTYTKWAAYASNSPEVVLTVASSVIADLSDVATSGDYNDLANKPDLGVYATKIELSDKVDKVSGKQLSAEDFTTALKAKLEGLSNYDDTELSNALSTLRGDFDALVSGDTTKAIKSFNDVIAFLDGIQDTQDLSSIIASIEQQIAGKMDRVTLAKVATSGSYEDLDNKPTIPSAVTESTVSGWGFTKNTGTYSKPSSGIPKSDLASAVRTSLGKADTAIQSLAGYATEDYVTDNYLPLNGGTVNGNLTIGSSSLTTTSYKLHVAGSIRATSSLIIGTKNESGTSPLQVQNSTYDATTSFTGTSLNFRINYPNGGFASTLTWLNNSATYAQLGVFMSQNTFSHLGVGQSIRSTSDCWAYINSSAATFNVAATFKKTIKIGEATLSYENGTLKVDKPFTSAN